MIAFVGVVLGSFLCLLQRDIKSVVAYSSVVHINFVLVLLLLGFRSLKVGSVLIIISHGYISTLMFFLAGEVFHVVGRRIIMYIGGFIVSSLLVSVIIMVVFLCNRGVPFSLSFFSEFMGFVGLFLCFKSLFIFLLMYFFVSFYFSIFVMVGFLIGFS